MMSGLSSRNMDVTFLGCFLPIIDVIQHVMPSLRYKVTCCSEKSVLSKDTLDVFYHPGSYNV
jgi:hypothetical protein